MHYNINNLEQFDVYDKDSRLNFKFIKKIPVIVNFKNSINQK